MKMLSKTETVKRLRKASAAVRALSRDIGSNFLVELGTRAVPVYSDTRPTNWYPEDDDLDDFWRVAEAGSCPQARTPGYVAHLYFTSPGEWGELISVSAVWLAPNGDVEVLDIDGRKV